MMIDVQQNKSIIKLTTHLCLAPHLVRLLFSPVFPHVAVAALPGTEMDGVADKGRSRREAPQTGIPDDVVADNGRHVQCVLQMMAMGSAYDGTDDGAADDGHRQRWTPGTVGVA